MAITYFTIHKKQKRQAVESIKSQNVVCMLTDIFLKNRLIVASC